jgi:solute carrier family 41
LDYTISSYKGIAVFQLVINGVGGNLVAVQASRISTSLHKDYNIGIQGTLNVCISPFHAFFAKGKFVKIYIKFIVNLTKDIHHRRTREDG